MDTDAVSEAVIAWQSIGNVNMINETGQSRPSVKHLSASVSLLACKNVGDFHNTRYVACQPTEASPCYVTVIHAMDGESALLYTTAIWMNTGSAMNNLQTLVYTLQMKYGPEAFRIIEATSNYL